VTMLRKLDGLVYATGIDRIIFMKFQPRTFRWTPLLVIVALVTGYTLMAKAQSPARPGGLAGWLLFYGAFLFAGFVRVFGPRFRPTFAHPLDERELIVRARAYAISGILIAGFAMLGCFYMPAAEVLDLWRPRLSFEWLNLGFGIQAVSLLLPTWIASWLERRPAADQD
jgi:hypothetical protein